MTEHMIKHEAVQIGTLDKNGYRSFQTPGDVCAACSDWEGGRMVPVAWCPEALDDYYAHTPWADREFDERVDRVFREMRAYRIAA